MFHNAPLNLIDLITLVMLGE